MAAHLTALLSDLVKINRIPDIRDMMIAATALQMNIPLATLNHTHFESMPGLTLAQIGSR